MNTFSMERVQLRFYDYSEDQRKKNNSFYNPLTDYCIIRLLERKKIEFSRTNKYKFWLACIVDLNIFIFKSVVNHKKKGNNLCYTMQGLCTWIFLYVLVIRLTRIRINYNIYSIIPLYFVFRRCIVRTLFEPPL